MRPSWAWLGVRLTQTSSKIATWKPDRKGDGFWEGATLDPVGNFVGQRKKTITHFSMIWFVIVLKWTKPPIIYISYFFELTPTSSRKRSIGMALACSLAAVHHNAVSSKSLAFLQQAFWLGIPIDASDGQTVRDLWVRASALMLSSRSNKMCNGSMFSHPGKTTTRVAGRAWTFGGFVWGYK